MLPFNILEDIEVILIKHYYKHFPYAHFFTFELDLAPIRIATLP